jgi:Cu+-exporting ATPase
MAPTAMPSTPTAPTAPTASDTKGGALKEPGDAKVGDKSRCPVSGEEFTITASSPHADYQGKTYYFCCPGCDKRFQENPGKYTSAKAK